MKIDMRRFAEADDVALELIKATRKALRKSIVTRNRVLVGSYVATLMTAGGIILPDKTIDEDRFQGKCGLVLAMGPQAFRYEDDPERKDAPKIGTWVLYRAADSWEVGIGEGAPCRFLYDDSIMMTDVDPRDYY